ncbi:hypothetical protein [Streptomyces sp. NPDC048392]|uniref:hypothetical protein n=1 Tax=Streptomyces sp. NPDC048392 TaxID=3365543 RepID=UPI00372094F5
MGAPPVALLLMAGGRQDAELLSPGPRSSTDWTPGGAPAPAYAAARFLEVIESRWPVTAVR